MLVCAVAFSRGGPPIMEEERDARGSDLRGSSSPRAESYPDPRRPPACVLTPLRGYWGTLTPTLLRRFLKRGPRTALSRRRRSHHWSATRARCRQAPLGPHYARSSQAGTDGHPGRPQGRGNAVASVRSFEGSESASKAGSGGTAGAKGPTPSPTKTAQRHQRTWDPDLHRQESVEEFPRFASWVGVYGVRTIG